MALLGVAAASQAVVVYDSIYTDSTQTAFKALTDTGSTPRSFKGDTFSIQALPAGQTAWRVDSISFWAVRWTSAFTGNVKAVVSLFGDSTDATTGTAPVFSNPIVSNATVNFGTQTMAVNTGYVYTVNFTNTFLTGPANHKYGFTVRLLADDVETPDLSPGLTHNAPNWVGTSSKGWYRDADNNGVLTGSDWRNFGTSTDDNLGLVVTATAVPEPGTMAALGLGIAAIAARRRRNRK
jgi:hypothetical protein